MRPSLLLVSTACTVPGSTYEYGVPLADLELTLISESVGVHPDRSVLFDPNNPFRGGLTGDMKFQVIADGPVAGFFAFATALAFEPTGENQWYTADQLHAVHDQRLAAPEDLALVRDLAIRGYQTVLDEFPGAVTFDATGRIPFDLLPLAVLGILDLGGTPANGWHVVEGPDGQLIAVQSGSQP